MDNKRCFKCNKLKPLNMFYKHKAMGDGHLNKCKSCAKDDVRKHRFENISKIRAYDRERGNRQTKEYRDSYKKEFPKKYKAHTMVSNAIRNGKLFKECCAVCGTNDAIHAHHDDYAKPLNVRWLCAAHHRQWHVENGGALNAK